MDSTPMNLFNQRFQALPPNKSQQQQPIYRPHSPSPEGSFPILAIAIIGILATAFLLVSYYVFVIKCCLNRHRIDFLRPFFISQSQPRRDPLIVYASTAENCGLDESVIRAIPVIKFQMPRERDDEERSFYECAICLNEFQEDDKLRVLPNCAHAFHIDCIDVWLQCNSNCPLCRSSITTTTQFQADQFMVPPSSSQDQRPFTETILSGDENFVVIEVSNGLGVDQATQRNQEGGNSGDLSVQSINPSPRKLVEQRILSKKARKLHHVSSMGDECIDVRRKDDQFSVQPIRRSISMDSSADRQLYISVQEIIQQNRNLNEVSTSEGCSSRVRRSFFSFGHRGSRNSVLPIQFEP